MGLTYSPLSSWWEAMQREGRPDAGERSESSTSSSNGQQEENWFELLRPQSPPNGTLPPTKPHLLQQGHNSQQLQDPKHFFFLHLFFVSTLLQSSDTPEQGIGSYYRWL